MSTAYWKQWSCAELMSMQGIEPDVYHDNDEDDCHDDNQEPEEHCCSSFCMDCLGLSWKDFM